MSHSKEPWSFNNREDITANGETLPLIGISIPMTAGARQNEARANARRIVACVNACRGIGTDTLERFDKEHAPENGFGLHRESKLESERDTYRDLCGELIKNLEHLRGAAMDIRCERTSIAAGAEMAIISAKAIMGENSNG